MILSSTRVSIKDRGNVKFRLLKSSSVKSYESGLAESLLSLEVLHMVTHSNMDKKQKLLH